MSERLFGLHELVNLRASELAGREGGRLGGSSFGRGNAEGSIFNEGFGKKVASHKGLGGGQKPSYVGR